LTWVRLNCGQICVVGVPVPHLSVIEDPDAVALLGVRDGAFG